MPRLTIAIPTVNRADLLGRAIESALAQTVSDIEIIVSDNGSTDMTPSVIARYSDSRLRVFRHPFTISPELHGRFLIEQACGDFFLGLSDDDFLEPEFAVEVLSLLDRHPECVFVYTGCSVHYEDVQVPAVVGPPLESGVDLLTNHYAGRREISWCACVTRVSLLRELGPQPPGIVLGDMFFWTRMALLGPVGCVPRVLSHYILLRPQPQNDNISHGTSPVVWGLESSRMATAVIESLRRTGISLGVITSLRLEARRHIARSVANQFVWTRIRGATLLQALGWIPQCLPHLTLTWPVVSRMTAALLIPRNVLRKALLKTASKLAAKRAGVS